MSSFDYEKQIGELEEQLKALDPGDEKLNDQLKFLREKVATMEKDFMDHTTKNKKK